MTPETAELRKRIVAVIEHSIFGPQAGGIMLWAHELADAILADLGLEQVGWFCPEHGCTHPRPNRPVGGVPIWCMTAPCRQPVWSGRYQCERPVGHDGAHEGAPFFAERGPLGSPETCPACLGKGVVPVWRGDAVATCQACDGTGRPNDGS